VITARLAWAHSPRSGQDSARKRGAIAGTTERVGRDTARERGARSGSGLKANDGMELGCGASAPHAKWASTLRRARKRAIVPKSQPEKYGGGGNAGNSELTSCVPVKIPSGPKAGYGQMFGSRLSELLSLTGLGVRLRHEHTDIG
jgi:hypothetical protein